MNHYTYKLTLPETGEYYIGVRSCKCNPNEDTYKGSMKTWKVDKSKLIKHIYTTFESRDLANEWEELAIQSCISDTLNRNAHIPSLGFCMYGVTMSTQSREKMAKAKKGKPLADNHKKKLSESTKGRKKSEDFKKMVIQSNKNRVYSEETKRKIANSVSETRKGKRLYTDGITKLFFNPGSEPVNFILAKYNKNK